MTAPLRNGLYIVSVLIAGSRSLWFRAVVLREELDIEADRAKQTPQL